MPETTVPTPSPLRRVAHALSSRRRTRRAPPRPPREAQLGALAAVLDAAVDALPVADRVVAACGEPGPVPDSLAQDGGRQLTHFNRLAVRLRTLTLDDDLADLRERASRLLAYDLWMIHESLKLAYTFQVDGSRIEPARLRINGLGAPANALCGLRDHVRRLARAESERATR